MGRCQYNANQSPKPPQFRLSGRQFAPFSQRGGAVLLEDFEAVEVAILIEMVMDRDIRRRKLMQDLDIREPSPRRPSRHRVFPMTVRGFQRIVRRDGNGRD
jgi:hypothetical protein